MFWKGEFKVVGGYLLYSLEIFIFWSLVVFFEDYR